LEEKGIMKCTSCNNPKDLKPKYITHRYRESGLDNVVLHGVEHFKCDQCGEDYFGYGDVNQLHDLIARTLVLKKGPLVGREIRFLRVHLGLSGKEYARRVGINPSTLSRYENDGDKPSKGFDSLLRAFVVTKLPDRDYDLHDKLLKEHGHPLKLISLDTTSSGQWKPSAA
jgi:putative transcriptional regulator